MKSAGHNTFRLFLWSVPLCGVLGGCFDLSQATLPSECEKCTMTACAEPLSACSKSERCLSRYRCLAKCDVSDAECRIACSADESGLTETMIELDTCRSAHCSDTCDECGGSMFDERGASCTECMQQEECCAKIEACAREEECNQAIRGRMACTDPFCAMNDGQPYDGTRERVYSEARDNIEECLRKCIYECNRGTDFDCLFVYKTPGLADPMSGITTMDFWGRDAFMGKPVSSIQVEARYDDATKEPIIGEESDAGVGLTKFSVPGTFSGSIRATKPGYLPSTFVYSRSLVGYEHWFLPLFTNGMADQASYLTGHDIDLMDHGVIVVNVFDCTHSLAPGIAVYYSVEDTDDGIVKSYTDALVFDAETTSTFSSGSVLLLNVPPGEGVLSMELAATGENLCWMDVEVIAGEVTWANMFPKIRF